MVTSKKQLKEIKKLPLKYTDTVVIVHALLKINVITIWGYSQENNVNHCYSILTGMSVGA